MNDALLPFLLGGLTTTCGVAALFFLRFWRTSGDRLFLFFSAAFVTLAVNWAALAIIDVRGDARPYAYVVRLAAFAIIIAGIADKNRRQDHS